MGFNQANDIANYGDNEGSAVPAEVAPKMEPEGTEMVDGFEKKED